MVGVAHHLHPTHTSLPFPLEIRFLFGRHLLVCPLHVPLMIWQEASKVVLAILMGAFCSALSSIWLFSIHGGEILTTSAPLSANCSCRMRLFATFPIFDIGTSFHQSRVSSSLLVCHPTFFPAHSPGAQGWAVQPCI
jgi:hypothetical protein